MKPSASPWWSNETAISLASIPQHMPPREDGRPWSAASAYRWTTVGHCGVRLRRFRACPGAWATTVEELRRWQAALSELSGEVTT